MRRTALALFLLCLPMVVSADVIHVPDDQLTIQAGVDAAMDGDTVLVADGIYTGPGNRDIDFLGKAITVRSENGAENCIIDCDGSSSDPHRGVYFHSGESLDSVLQGFTIRNGWREGDGDPNTYCGGGIYCVDSSPTITNNTIVDNEAGDGGGIYCDSGSSPVITGNTISANSATGRDGFPWGDPRPGGDGGGIYCGGGSPAITDNIIAENIAFLGGFESSTGSGGGIYCTDCVVALVDNTITENQTAYGGGILFRGGASSLMIDNNTITANTANGLESGDGGGICFSGSTLTIMNSTISGNSAYEWGGGILCFGYLTITNCIIAGNSVEYGFPSVGGGIFGGIAVIVNCTIIGNSAGPQGYGGGVIAGGSIFNSILWGNYPDEIDAGAASLVTYSDVQGGWPGEGNIDADPLFVTRPDGGYYLSQVAAGQTENSPCVDAGDPSSELIQGTTRTDLVQDWGVVDMGYHYPRVVQPFITTGPGPAEANPPQVRVFPSEKDAEHLFDFLAYGPMHYGVNVTCGDVNVNGMDEILTGAGPGDIYGPHVRGFQVDGEPLPGLSFLAYGTNRWGVNVAAGDIDGDAFDEIITGAGPGAVFGPHVRGWNYDGTGTVTPVPGCSFFAYGTPKWGVNVAAGDIDGDGYDEIVTGAGPGAVYGPHVRAWNYDGAPPVTPKAGVSFFAYGTHRYGVNITCGDVDGDGIDEIVTGPGPGSMFGAHVRGWNCDGSTAAPLPGLNFFAWPTTEARYGAKVFAGADLDGDGWKEIVVGCGPDPDAGTEVKVFQYDGSQVTEWFWLDAFGDLGLTHGTTVAAGRF